MAGIHPMVPGKGLTRSQFDTIWAASVRLMYRAFTLGSIVTVFPEEAVAAGNPRLRRWIYNSARCGKCSGPVKSWDLQGRTCYACERCQPRQGGDGVSALPLASSPQLFLSHCASDSLADRMSTPQKLTVAELRAALEARGQPTAGKKAVLVSRMQALLDDADMQPATTTAPRTPDGSTNPSGGLMRSARAAALDKAEARESRAVEHIAEFEDVDDGAPEWVPTTLRGDQNLEAGAPELSAEAFDGEMESNAAPKMDGTTATGRKRRTACKAEPPGTSAKTCRKKQRA